MSKTLRVMVISALFCVFFFTGCDIINQLINSAPVSDAGNDQTVSLGERVTLDGSASFDTDGDTITYLWAFAAKGDGSALTDADIEGSTSSAAYFNPDVTGTFDIRLTVSDGTKSAEDVVRITVNEVDFSQYEGEDSEGNIVLNNSSGTKVILYKGDVPVKIIPNDSSDFLVNIANPASDIVDLRLYRLSAVSGDIENPDFSLLFKRWNVVLSVDTEVEHRVTWRIEPSTEESNTGTLTLAYVGGTEYSVDVYLNSQTGAKIISLSPGQQNKRVGIDFGNYTIHYRYWESNPQTPEGITEIGWVETELVNTQEVAIYVILNASRETRHLQVPHWNGGSAIPAQYGTVQIRNNTSLPVQIWIGAQLIEQVMYTDQPIDNYSTIAANDVTVYTLPIDDYNLTAKDIATTQDVSSTALTIIADQQIDWTISN